MCKITFSITFYWTTAKYLFIASMNLILYKSGLITVGVLACPPNLGMDFTSLKHNQTQRLGLHKSSTRIPTYVSNFLSHVNVLM